MIEYFISFGVGGICGTAIYLCGHYLRKQRETRFIEEFNEEIQRLENGLVYQRDGDLAEKLGGKND